MKVSITVSEAIQITVKVSQNVVERADALIPDVAHEQGRDASRADVFRRALTIGLDELTRRARSRALADGNEETSG